MTALRTKGEARIIVSLRPPDVGSSAKRALDVAAAQDAVLAAAPGFALSRRYAQTAALAGTVTSEEALGRLRAAPGVAAVSLDVPGGGGMVQAAQGIGVPPVRALGWDGTGVTVAVLDSGVDLAHPDLGGVVAQHCFTQGSCPPGGTTEGTDAQDGHGHGSHVTGIITGDGTEAPTGAAPAAQVVAVRVLDDSAGGYLSDWLAGLDWVLANLDSRPVAVVNMSLATYAVFAGPCDAMWPAFTDTVAALRRRGVLVVACSGNQGSVGQIAAPACITGVLAVGATYDATLGREPDLGTYADVYGGGWPTCSVADARWDRVGCFSNSSPRVNLMAPGSVITSVALGGGSTNYTGTSQATALVSGVAALLAQCRPGLSGADAALLLEQTGIPVRDDRNGLTVPRIDAQTAARACSDCAARADGEPCLDGSFCDGADSCGGGSCAVHDGSPCDDGDGCTVNTCDEAGRSCSHQPVAESCVIDGACVAAGTVSPDSSCRACLPGASTGDWSPLPKGTECMGGSCSDDGTCEDDGGCAAGGSGRDPLFAVGLLLALAHLARRRRA